MERSPISRTLTEALTKRGLSVYQLSKKVEHIEMRGLSYSSLRNYGKGKTTPRHEVARVLADVMNVNFVWFLTGEGDPDKLTGSLRGMAKAEPPGDDSESIEKIVQESLRQINAKEALLREMFQEGLGDPNPPHEIRTTMTQLALAYVDRCGQPDGGDEWDLMLDVLKAVSAPLRSLYIDPSESQP